MPIKSDRYQLAFRVYRRPFRRSLHTSYGAWSIREGIILRLTDAAGRVGWGEIAPLAWFGSESLAIALEFCQQCPAEVTSAAIFAISPSLPACQFGFESAWESLQPAADSQKLDLASLSFSGLLPTGEAALEGWRSLWDQGFSTFKWKIGVADVEAELEIFEQLVQVLPPEAKLRLDANGGLTPEMAIAWLEVCDRAGVEFLEQPLAPDQFEAMLALSQRYQTPLALDESVATIDQLEARYQQGWRGVFVVKPAIAGSPRRLRQLFQQHSNLDWVFSTVFETAIGRQAGLRLAAELSQTKRAMGYGVHHWFADGLDQLTDAEFERIWNSL